MASGGIQVHCRNCDTKLVAICEAAADILVDSHWTAECHRCNGKNFLLYDGKSWNVVLYMVELSKEEMLFRRQMGIGCEESIDWGQFDDDGKYVKHYEGQEPSSRCGVWCGCESCIHPISAGGSPLSYFY